MHHANHGSQKQTAISHTAGIQPRKSSSSDVLNTHTLTHTHSHTHTHTHTHTHSHTITHTHSHDTHTRAHSHTQPHSHAHNHTHTHTHNDTHTPTRSHTHHTHSHTHIYIFCLSIYIYWHLQTQVQPATIHLLAFRSITVEVLYYPKRPDFRNCNTFWEVSRLRPFVHLVKKKNENEYGASVVHTNNVQQTTSYLTENRLPHHYATQTLIVF